MVKKFIVILVGALFFSCATFLGLLLEEPVEQAVKGTGTSVSSTNTTTTSIGTNTYSNNDYNSNVSYFNSFAFTRNKNYSYGLNTDCIGVISGNLITVYIPSYVDASRLVPTYSFLGKSVRRVLKPNLINSSNLVERVYAVDSYSGESKEYLLKIYKNLSNNNTTTSTPGNMNTTVTTISGQTTNQARNVQFVDLAYSVSGKIGIIELSEDLNLSANNVRLYLDNDRSSYSSPTNFIRVGAGKYYFQFSQKFKGRYMIVEISYNNRVVPAQRQIYINQ